MQLGAFFSVFASLLVVGASFLVGRSSQRLPVQFLLPVALASLLVSILFHSGPEVWEAHGWAGLAWAAVMLLLLTLLEQVAHRKIGWIGQMLADALHNVGDGVALAAGFATGIGAGLAVLAGVGSHELARTAGEVEAYQLTAERPSALVANRRNLIAGLGMVAGALVPALHTVEEVPVVAGGALGVLVWVVLVRLLPAWKQNLPRTTVQWWQVGVVSVVVGGLVYITTALAG